MQKRTFVSTFMLIMLGFVAVMKKPVFNNAL